MWEIYFVLVKKERKEKVTRAHTHTQTACGGVHWKHAAQCINMNTHTLACVKWRKTIYFWWMAKRDWEVLLSNIHRNYDGWNFSGWAMRKGKEWIYELDVIIVFFLSVCVRFYVAFVAEAICYKKKKEEDRWDEEEMVICYCKYIILRSFPTSFGQAYICAWCCSSMCQASKWNYCMSNWISCHLA